MYSFKIAKLSTLLIYTWIDWNNYVTKVMASLVGNSQFKNGDFRYYSVFWIKNLLDSIIRINWLSDQVFESLALKSLDNRELTYSILWHENYLRFRLSLGLEDSVYFSLILTERRNVYSNRPKPGFILFRISIFWRYLRVKPSCVNG